MTTIFKTLSLLVGVTVLTATSFAGSLPELSFRGSSTLIKNAADTMALVVKKDPNNPGRYYALLAEYTRLPISVRAEKDFIFRHTSLGKNGPITSWVPRTYMYRIDQVTELVYKLSPLHVTSSSEIDVDDTAKTSLLFLDRKNNPVGAAVQSLDGAFVNRLDPKSGAIAETIKFEGNVNSTWEDYVVGSFFGTKENTGKDYLKKASNTFLTEDGEAHFFQKDIRGVYDVLPSKNAPGLYTFRAKRADNKGNDKVESRIGIFIDIVNWKRLGIEMFTTEELLMINPEDGSDVGFYYERH